MELVEADAATLDGLAAGSSAHRLPPGGVEAPEVLAILRDALASGARTWLMVADGEVVGLCGTKSAPHAGTVEIGYGVAASRRGRGHAAVAVAALLALLGREGVARVSAQTDPGNPASERVLRRAGFLRAGTRMVPEGEAALWWRAL